MKDVINTYMWFCIEVAVCVFSIIMILSIYNNDELLLSNSFEMLEQSITSNTVMVDYDVVTIEEITFEVKGAILDLFSIFEWQEYVNAQDKNGNNLIDYVVINGFVDTENAGRYEVLFTLYWNGQSITKQAEYYVNE